MTTTDTNTESDTKKAVQRPFRKARKTAPSREATSANASAMLARTRTRSVKTTPTVAPHPTKKDLCLALLSRAEGAGIEELKQATGWQTHSVRGFLSGEIRKRMGRELTSEADAGGERRYRIVDAPASC